MRIIKCKNNHFYDGDKFMFCPICQVETIYYEMKTVTEEHLVEQEVIETKSSQKLPLNYEIDLTEHIETDHIGNNEDIFIDEISHQESFSKDDLDVTEHHEELETVIDNLTYDDILVDQTIYNLAPVIGWLLCIKGQYLGQSYEIRYGSNQLSLNHIAKQNLDMSENDTEGYFTSISFNSGLNKFLIVPGISRELVYLNGNLLLEKAFLNQNDKVQIGESTLMFLPLLSDLFSWNKYQKED